MNNILTLNAISPKADVAFNENYTVGSDVQNPVGIMLRSFNMHDYELPADVIAVARAGAGTNNIPCDKLAEQGVVVFNTPGANANAVKELVMAALLLGSRKIAESMDWVKTLKGKGDEVGKLVEKGKGQFVGPEITGKTLGIIGLGAIGARVANAAIALGMEVVGYDPYLSVESALSMSRHVVRVNDLDTLIKTSDYITLHVPLLKDNKGFINEDMIAKMKDGVVIINAARGELVDNAAILAATKSGKVSRYVTDFPNDDLIGAENVVCIPHLGASTPEAEDNCAVMAAKQLVDYIENGNIVNSVNYPACSCPRAGAMRIAVHHLNQQNMIAQMTTLLAAEGVNIENLLNKSKGNYAYTIIDTNTHVSQHTVDAMKALEGVVRVRVIH
ncbi:MAG: 3-phosphoglycerate dehydrogenase [Clostridia bacterium]|nr:3-phosphoglycerate dehydrogenase [Clostridia bacterium]